MNETTQNEAANGVTIPARAVRNKTREEFTNVDFGNRQCGYDDEEFCDAFGFEPPAKGEHITFDLTVTNAHRYRTVEKTEEVAL